MYTLLLFCIVFFFRTTLSRDTWSEQQAWAWFNAQKPYIAGAEFTVSSAANQLEMWQAETFDANLIDFEISLGPKVGYTVFRIFLHDMVYFQDPVGFKNRLNITLNILEKYGMKALFVFFDTENADENPKLGAQPRPIPGICNSVYAYTPNRTVFDDHTLYASLKPYITDVVGTFATDPRVLAWDVYNEPDVGNSNDVASELLTLAFEWAKEANPTQPVTSALTRTNFNRISDIQINNSDVISFHNYDDARGFEAAVIDLQKLGRPLIASEYMARELNSYFTTVLPIGKKYNIGMLAWGHVLGKTEWNMPWDSTRNPYVEYPPVTWFQDSFRQDGSPYLLEEAQIIKRLNGCPLGYHSTVNNWTCYNAYDTPKNWIDTKLGCKNTWSNVVTISNAFENSDILTYSKNLTTCNSFYIGLSKINSQWKWPMTTPYNNPTYRNWKSGYPTNDATANCVVLNKADGTWTNQDCSVPQCYICSY